VQQQRNPCLFRLAFGHKSSALQLRQPARRSQSEPLPRPDSLVVKKGSQARPKVLLSMPQPVSLTVSSTQAQAAAFMVVSFSGMSLAGNPCNSAW